MNPAPPAALPSVPPPVWPAGLAEPVTVPGWLVRLGEAVVAPVLTRLRADPRFGPRCRDWTAEQLALLGLAWALGSVGGLSATSASETTGNNVAAQLARSERENVNLNDLVHAGLVGFAGPAPYRLRFVPLPVGALPAGARADAAAASAGLSTTPGVDVHPDHFPELSFRAVGAPQMRDTLAQVVVQAAFPHLRVSEPAARVGALVALDPYSVLAPAAGGPVLEFARRWFFACWDAFVRAQLGGDGRRRSLADVWAAAEAFWVARACPHRVAAGGDEPLRYWLHRVLFLGAGAGFRTGGAVDRELGRSVVMQVLGFVQRDEVRCAACGAVDVPGNAEHPCPGSPHSRPAPFTARYRVQNPDAAAAQSAAYFTCTSQDAAPACAAEVTLGASERRPVAPDVPAAEVFPAWPAGGAPSGVWINPAEPVHRSARVEFRGGRELSGAEVEVWARPAGCGPVRLARARLARPAAKAARGQGALVVRAVKVDAGQPESVVEEAADCRAVTVWLLHPHQLLLVTALDGAAEVSCRVSLNGCGHIWRAAAVSRPAGGRERGRGAGGGAAAPEPCPRCGGPASGEPTYYAVGLRDVQPVPPDGAPAPEPDPLPPASGTLVRAYGWDAADGSFEVEYADGGREVRVGQTESDYWACLAACGLPE